MRWAYLGCTEGVVYIGYLTCGTRLSIRPPFFFYLLLEVDPFFRAEVSDLNWGKISRVGTEIGGCEKGRRPTGGKDGLVRPCLGLSEWSAYLCNYASLSKGRVRDDGSAAKECKDDGGERERETLALLTKTPRCWRAVELVVQGRRRGLTRRNWARA